MTTTSAIEKKWHCVINGGLRKVVVFLVHLCHVFDWYRLLLFEDQTPPESPAIDALILKRAAHCRITEQVGNIRVHVRNQLDFFLMTSQLHALQI